jgi:hypothetical protein
MNIVKGGKECDSMQPPNPALMAAIGKLAEEVTKAGIMLDNGGLLPTSMGATIRAKGGKLVVKDGPFTEAKEMIGGYAIMQVRSKEEAIELGRRFLQLHIDVLGSNYEGELEIRQMFEDADIPHSR